MIPCSDGNHTRAPRPAPTSAPRGHTQQLHLGGGEGEREARPGVRRLGLCAEGVQLPLEGLRLPHGPGVGRVPWGRGGAGGIKCVRYGGHGAAGHCPAERLGPEGWSEARRRGTGNAAGARQQSRGARTFVERVM